MAKNLVFLQVILPLQEPAALKRQIKISIYDI